MAKEHANEAPRPSPAAARPARAAVESTQVVYAKLDGREYQGYLSRPAQPAGGDRARPAIILIHEWWGLNDNIRSIARQLAGEGYTALAVDIYAGQRAETPAAAKTLMTAALADPASMLENLRQAHSYLVAQGATRTGTIGWCFGGGLSLEAGLLLGDQLAAVVMYYGRPISDSERLRTLRAPLLGLFGEDDGGIPVAGVRALERALRELGKSAEIRVYSGAGHAFANPSGSRYQAAAAEDAWARTLGFFEKHLQH